MRLSDEALVLAKLSAGVDVEEKIKRVTDLSNLAARGVQSERHAVQQSLTRQGAIPTLIELMRQHNAERALQSEACVALGHVAAGHHAGKEIAVDCGGL